MLGDQLGAKQGGKYWEAETQRSTQEQTRKWLTTINAEGGGGAFKLSRKMKKYGKSGKEKKQIRTGIGMRNSGCHKMHRGDGNQESKNRNLDWGLRGGMSGNQRGKLNNGKGDVTKKNRRRGQQREDKRGWETLESLGKCLLMVVRREETTMKGVETDNWGNTAFIKKDDVKKTGHGQWTGNSVTKKWFQGKAKTTTLRWVQTSTVCNHNEGVLRGKAKNSQNPLNKTKGGLPGEIIEKQTKNWEKKRR